MDKGYEKERFESLSIKSSIAKNFRKYCKRISESQSMTLLLMLEFFEYNEVSPKDRLGETISGLKAQIKKRFNAVIAIIRDIEKNQTKPTAAMLLSLLEEASGDEEEEYHFETPELISENEELDYYRDAYSSVKENYIDLKHDMKEIIQNIKYVKSSFGNGYYKLELSIEGFENFKKNIEDVHYHNTTETNR